MPIEAIIFDMDGVLVDSEAYWWESRLEFAAELGKTWTMDDQHACMGRNTSEWGRVMQERLHLHDMPLDSLTADIRRRVIARVEARLPILPGAIEAVQTAASLAPVALATGSPVEIAELIMRLTGLDKVFKVMVFADTMPRGKPAPDVYLETARQLNVPPARCLGIEDSPNGLRSLHAAGMIALAVPSPDFPLPPEILALAHRKIDSLLEFTPELVRQIEHETA